MKISTPFTRFSQIPEFRNFASRQASNPGAFATTLYFPVGCFMKKFQVGFG